MFAAEIAIICSEKLNSSAGKFAVFERGRVMDANRIGVATVGMLPATLRGENLPVASAAKLQCLRRWVLITGGLRNEDLVSC